MTRFAARALAGAATAAVASAMLMSPASAATATLTVKVVTKPIVSSVTGASILQGTISATASVAGTVAFTTAATATAEATVIKGCEAVATTTASPFVAMCSSWTGVAPGAIYVGATLTPTDTTIAKVTATPLASLVSKPINETGEKDLSLYVDTVNGSSTKVNLSDVNAGGVQYVTGGGCVVMNQFMQGQQIVWRIYVNNYANGGAPLTGQDATMNIKIAGWDTPVALSYGDHSGTSFWAGALNTGTAGSGKFSALGSINYTINITMLEKPAVTKDVTTTKYVKVVDPKTKKAVKVNGAFVWKPVKVKSTVVVTPAVVGRTIAMTPASWAAAASVLTLSAAPAK